MPQMAPYNWMFLMLYFMILMMHIISHLHFSYIYNKTWDKMFFKKSDLKLKLMW